MAKEERRNEEAAMNNNLHSSTLQMNQDIIKQHQQPEIAKTDRKKRLTQKLSVRPHNTIYII
jgi:hypothetical protein